MRKSFALAFALLAMALSANATVRPAHKLYHVDQSDGTTVMLYKNGNGYLAYYTTADDQVVVRNAKGTLCYAKLQDGKLVATDIQVHNMAERTQQEKAFVAQNTLKPTDADVKAIEQGPKRQLTRTIATSGNYGLGTYGVSAKGSVPSIGDVKIPVVMVEFSDLSFQETTTPDKVSRMLNAEGYHDDTPQQKGSVRDYFMSQSNGLFRPSFEVVARVKLSRDYAYYGSNSGGLDSKVMTCVREAVKLAMDQGADFTQFLVNGKVPNVIIYYAGLGEATGGGENTLWPHERDLDVLSQTIEGVRFSSYFVGNELDGDAKATTHNIMGIGVLVHEFSHAMGLPDIYNTSSSASSETDSPMGQWSIMNSGPYVGGSYAPMGYNAYERCYMGWLTLKEANGAESVVLNNMASAEGNSALIIHNPNNSYEYFILENRQPDTWFPSDFGNGLLLTRYVFDNSAWQNNYVNIYKNSRRAIVVTAGGRNITNAGQPSDLYGNGVNNIESLPCIAGMPYSGMPVYKILKRADGTVSLNLRDRTLNADPVVGSDVYEKVTDVSVLAANDEVVFVNEADEVAFGTELYSNKVMPVGVKIENGKMYGNDLVVPMTLLKTTTGGNYGFRTQKKAFLTVNNSGVQYLSSSNSSCQATIAITDGNAAIRFNTTAANKYLTYNGTDYVFGSASEPAALQIYRKVATDGISGVTAEPAEADGKMYNLAGQRVGNDYKGIVIVNGKKVMRK